MKAIQIGGEGIDLAKLLAGAAGGEDPDRVKPMDTTEVIFALRNAYDVFNQTHTFAPGQIVRPKKGIDCMVKDTRGGVMIFITYAKPIDVATTPLRGFEAGNPAAVMQFDCIIGHISPDGAMIEHFHNSRYIEPYPHGKAE